MRWRDGLRDEQAAQMVYLTAFARRLNSRASAIRAARVIGRDAGLAADLLLGTGGKYRGSCTGGFVCYHFATQRNITEQDGSKLG